MAEARIETLNRQKVLIVEEPQGDGTVGTRVIPVEALASWSELLGYTTDADTLAAIIHVQDNGEPEPDVESGENVWTESYHALMARQAQIVQPEAKGMARTMSLRIATVDPLDAARSTARSRLGVPEPITAQPAARMSFRSLGIQAVRPDPVAEALAALAPEIEVARATFVAALTPTTS